MIYEAACNACTHAFDYYATIAERDKVPCCPKCQSKKTVREFRTPAGVAMDQDFSFENNGRGRFMPQLAKKFKDKNGDWGYDQNDPKAYHKSQKSAIQECSKRGLTATKA
jgi:putative FmdB family regulatory protein